MPVCLSDLTEMAEKYDVFVGNLTFNTSEEQLRELFQFIGDPYFLPSHSIPSFSIFILFLFRPGKKREDID